MKGVEISGLCKDGYTVRQATDLPPLPLLPLLPPLPLPPLHLLLLFFYASFAVM